MRDPAQTSDQNHPPDDCDQWFHKPPPFRLSNCGHLFKSAAAAKQAIHFVRLHRGTLCLIRGQRVLLSERVKKLFNNSLKDLSHPPVTHSEHEPDGERNTNEYHDNDRNWNTFSGGETSARGRLSK
jgi:hypothetical protein